MFKLYRVEGVDMKGERCKCYIIAEGFDDAMAAFVVRLGGSVHRCFLLACNSECHDPNRPLLLRA